MLSFFRTESVDHIPLTTTFLGNDYPQEPINRPYGTPDYLCFFSQEGDGELILQNERMKVRQGECFIILPETPHRYHSLQDKWIVSNIGFTGPLCAQLFDTLGINESGVYSITDPGIFLGYIHTLRQLTETATSKARLSAVCYQFLLELSQVIMPSQIKEFTDRDLSEDSYSFQVLQYLEKRLAEPISIERLADTLGLNKDYLCTVFKKETGLTIIQYAQRLRIGRARMLLERFPEKDVAQIGRMCGYESPSYFGLQFKKTTGLTPNQYRQSLIAIHTQ